MTARTSAFTHVLFKNIINNELMIASLEKCHIQDDNVTYKCGEKTFNGEFITVGPKGLYNKLMKKMNDYTTDYLYSSLPEEEDDDDGEYNDDDDDNETNVLKGGKLIQDINPVSIRSSSPNVICSSNDITNNNDNVHALQNGFALNYGTINTLYASLKEARNQLTKDMKLQQSPQHQGMYNPLSKEILSLMNKQLILPWTRRHRCRTSSSQCSFCEEYISPRDEIKLPELELPNINELKQQQQQQQQILIQSTRSSSKSKFTIEMSSGGDHHSSSSSSTSLNIEEDGAINVNTTASIPATTTTPELKVENNPHGEIWIISQDVFYFKLDTLHIHLQFFYSELDRVIDIDALYYLLCCLKLLILNDECLETAAKDNHGILSYCLEKLLVPHIWKIFALGHGHLNECCVPLLLHALNYELGKTALWNILERDFSSTHWKARSSAGTRVIALYSLLKSKLIKNNYNVLSVLAFAFLNLIISIEDVEPTVSQKAMCSLETLGDA
ncbi:unnamed protein product [Rotaria sp. Silwood1]|nr:unnamed protein product [Rotaria sp. Silwood1]